MTPKDFTTPVHSGITEDFALKKTIVALFVFSMLERVEMIS